MSNIPVQVLLFARLADQAATATLNLDIKSTLTVKTLFDQLACKYHFETDKRLRAAKNHQFCHWDDVIAAHDVIAFIPAVSGG